MSIVSILESLPGNGNQLTQLGCLKIGGKSRTPRQSKSGQTWFAPEKWDHFSVTTMNRDATGHLIEDARLMAELTEKYGDADGKLRAIPIRLLSDDIDDVLQSAFCWYGRKSIGARSDGKTVTWFYDPKSMQRYDPPAEAEWTPEMLDWSAPGGGKMFKVHSILNCVVASSESRWGGVYKFRTTSIISLRQLHGSLVHLSQLTGGILVGMPLMLCVRPIQVAPEGKATTVHVVHVELRGGDLQQIQNQALEQSRFRLAFAGQIQKTQVQYRKLLAGPGMESDEEAADIEDEFQPAEASEIVTVPPEKPFGMLDDAPEASPPAHAQEQPCPKNTTTIPALTPPAGTKTTDTTTPPKETATTSNGKSGANSPASAVCPAPTPPVSATPQKWSETSNESANEAEDQIGAEADYEPEEEKESSETSDAAQQRLAVIMEICDQPWQHFVAAWARFAKRDPVQVSGIANRIALRLGRKKREEEISRETRRQWVEAGESGALNWTTGELAHALAPTK